MFLTYSLACYDYHLSRRKHIVPNAFGSHLEYLDQDIFFAASGKRRNFVVIKAWGSSVRGPSIMLTEKVSK